MNRTHKIALDPTVRQEMYFRRCCGVARFTFNWALSEWKKQYAAGGKPSGTALKKQFHDRDINAAINLEKLGAASPEVTPVEKKALARRPMRAKPASVKRELTILENGSFSKN